MYEVISYNDKSKWQKELKSLPINDVFYCCSYCTLYLTMGDGEPYLFIYSDKSGSKIAYVFFKRPIHFLPFINTSEELYDIITPSYGYGGPLYNSIDPSVVTKFRQEFGEYCQSENIISEFIRFHPMYQNQEFLYDTMDVFFDRETIFIDLKKNEEDLMKNYHKNHRRNLNKALKNPLKFVVHEAERAIEQAEPFYQLYTETMDKLNASKYSYFSMDYIKNLLAGLDKNSCVSAVYYEDKLVSAALCIFEDGIIHYHLGCSDEKYLNLGVNVYLFHNIVLWAKQKGFHSFHLGGGHVGRDSLFQFKHRFNKDGILDFYIGRRVHNKGVYQQLVLNWEETYNEAENTGFFPAYRAKPLHKFGSQKGRG